MAGYKSYRKSKVKKYRRGGAVMDSQNQTPAGSPSATPSDRGRQQFMEGYIPNAPPPAYPPQYIPPDYLSDMKYNEYIRNLTPPGETYYQKGGLVGGQNTAASTRTGRRSTDSPFGTSPGSGEQTPREPVFDWSKRVGTTPGYAHWGGVGRAQMLGPTTMGGYAGGPASMDQYYGWGQPNPPDAPLYKKGGKVMDQYIDSKKGKPVKKKSKKKKGYAKGGKVNKDGKQIELIRSMRGMSLRELMDLNKKMVRG